MWAWMMVAGLVSLTGYAAVSHEVRQPPSVTAASSDQAWNLGVYRDAVRRFAEANPGFNGTVPDASLVFPSWYHRHPLWSNTLQGKQLAVFAREPVSAEFGTQLTELSSGSYFAGIADAAGGRLVSPLRGPTTVPLPAGVPDGVPVWLAVVR